ncbi:hypothetical protein LCGC14_1299800 [marine sediment metagenome]|uniref:Uncharacterized protein n=1 Tax=marine sediment metagenome TaxID=412755 RepID=A0A0F9N6K1_9ZZZZ
MPCAYRKRHPWRKHRPGRLDRAAGTHDRRVIGVVGDAGVGSSRRPTNACIQRKTSCYRKRGIVRLLVEHLWSGQTQDIRNLLFRKRMFRTSGLTGGQEGQAARIGAVGGGIAKKKQKAMLCGRLPLLTCPCPGLRSWTRAGWAREGAGDQIRIESGGVRQKCVSLHCVATCQPLVAHLSATVSPGNDAFSSL